MRWLIKVGEAILGPFEEHQTLDTLRDHPTASVRGEGGGAWMAATQSPFASYLAESTTVAAAVPTPRGPTAHKKSPVRSKVLIVLVVFFILMAIAAAQGWIGVAMGLALSAWTVHRHRKGLPSVLGVAFGRGRGIVLSALTVIASILMVLEGVGALRVAQSQKRAAQQQRQAEEQEQAATDAKRENLEQKLPTKLQVWRQKLQEIRAYDADVDLTIVEKETATIAAEIDTAVKLLRNSPPALAEFQTEVSRQAALIDARLHLPQKVESLEQSIATGKKLSRGHTFIEADASFDAALKTVSEIEGGGNELKPFYPTGFTPATKRVELTKLKASISNAVGQERRRQEREEKKRQQQEAKQAAYAALCGEKPVVSAWDGAVIGLESAIKESANDPDSIDVKECTDPLLSTDECWVFACKVRGKNAFGAMILQHRAFSYSKALGFRDR